MNKRDFYYDLPKELIAQTPLEKRDEARLLVLDKKTGDVSHKKFFDIINYLEKGDTLVLNNTKVLPARVIGRKINTNATIEILLLKEHENDIWQCLCKPARRVKVGTEIFFSDKLKAICTEVKDEGIRYFKFEYHGIFYEILDELGSMPLPPYIHEKLDNKDMYQTVYSKELGSAAAPTAGLHFTEELLEKIRKKGVNICYVTLHVGLGTFRPVSVDKIEEHKMHSEYYMIDKAACDILNKTVKEKKKIIAVGTTSTRVLETAVESNKKFVEKSGFTDIFIYPGYQFKAVDSLITNFHLPESTLVMLTSALAGKEHILNAYKIAVEEKYRFFSFGDAMFIK